MKKFIAILSVIALMAGASTALAVNYTYDGGTLPPTWTEGNDSGAWDGSTPGDPLGTPPATPAPGGIGSMTDGGDTFLRVQDTGDPRDYGWPDPSNRKLYLAHDLVGGSLDPQDLAGLSLEFRIRLATAATGGIDAEHPDGGGGSVAWPTNGIGSTIGSNGKGMVVLGANGNADDAGGWTSNDNPSGALGFSLIHGQQLWDQFRVEDPENPGTFFWTSDFSNTDPAKDYLLLNALDRDNQDDGGDTDNDAADAWNYIELTTPDGALDWQAVEVDVSRTAGSDGFGEFDLAVAVNGDDKGTFEVTASWAGYGSYEWFPTWAGGPGTKMMFVGVAEPGTGGVGAFDLDYVTVVPEPTTFALALLSLGGLGLAVRRRR